MIDAAMIAVGSIVSLGILMWLCAAWCDLAAWAIDAIADVVQRRHG